MNTEHTSADTKHYRRLLLMAVLSFIAMYVLMYAMVDAFANVYMNVNQFYMAGLMAAPMVIIEVAIMGTMFHHKKLNAAITPMSGTCFSPSALFVREIATLMVSAVIAQHTIETVRVKNPSGR